MKPRKNMAGVRYGRVTGVSLAGRAVSGDLNWQFRCDCGSDFIANGAFVRSGKVTTCPSCSRERTRVASLKHGLSSTPEFSTWTDIKTRCYNKNTSSFENYGGRGVTVCDRWLASFEDFLLDMGLKPSRSHSIERNDVNGHYEPSNCRWATPSEQSLNKRNSRLIQINGEEKNLITWARESGLSSSALLKRIDAGVSGLDLLKPKNKGCISFNGVTDTLKGWSRRTGIKSSTIAMRITSYKWSVEDALTKGVKSCV